MATSIAISNLLAKEGLRRFYQQSRYIRTIDMSRNNVMQDGTYSSGNTVNYRVPWIPGSSNTGNNLMLQGVSDSTIPITVYQINQAANLTLNLKTTSLPEDEFTDRVADPMSERLARDVEIYAMTIAAYQTSNVFGTPGTQLSTNAVIATSRATLEQQLLPDMREINLACSPLDQAALFGTNQSLFNPANVISGFFNDGEIRKIYGVDVYTSNSLPTILSMTTADVGTPTVTSISADGTSVVISGLGANALIPAGTKIQFLGTAQVNQVDPQTKFSLSTPATFSVWNGITTSQFSMPTFNNITASAGGVATVPLYSGIYDSTAGALQNVSALPLAGAAVTFVGSSLNGARYRVALMYHKMGIQACSVPLATSMQEGVTSVKREKDTGLAILGSHQYVIGSTTDAFGQSLLFGSTLGRPNWTGIIASK